MIRLWMMNSEFSIAGRAGRCRLDPEVIESALARGRHSHKIRLRFSWSLVIISPHRIDSCLGRVI